jgi:hypothetical protein
MPNQPTKNTQSLPGQNLPWYRQFWPWFIIALPAAAVIASFFTLWLAISNPDYLVVDDEEYRRLNSGLKAQEPAQETEQDQTGKSEPPSG